MLLAESLIQFYEINIMYTLTLTATSTASANGLDTNTATAVLMNGSSYVSGETVEFRLVTGNAVFPDGTTIKRNTTNSLGEASVDYTDVVQETISVMAISAADATVYDVAISSFGGIIPELNVKRIYNDNGNEFSTGGPHYLFKGAIFYIELNENLTSTSWTCDDANIEVKNLNGLGRVKINGTPTSDVINIKFSNASGSGEYDVGCNLYVDNAHAENLKSESPTEKQYIDIYNEWGRLSTFGWGSTSQFYCYNITGSGAGWENYYYVNMDDGSSSSNRGEGVNYATHTILGNDSD